MSLPDSSSYELETWANPPLWAWTSLQAGLRDNKDLQCRTACQLSEKLACKGSQAVPVATAAAAVANMIRLTSGDLGRSRYT